MFKLVFMLGIGIVLTCWIASKPSASLPIQNCDKSKAVVVQCKAHNREGTRAGDYIPIDDKNAELLKSVTYNSVQYCDSPGKTVIAAKKECRLITIGVD
jgi:hypothetical protein